MEAPPIWRLDRAALAGAVGTLADDGVVIVQLDAGAAETPDDLHGALAVALGFAPQEGRTLDTLHDCLGEVIAELPPSGLALVLRRFGAFEARHPVDAPDLLEIVAEHVRDAGGAMICIAEVSS